MNIKFCFIIVFLFLSHTLTKCQAQTSFKKHIISNRFVSEGAAIGDVNHDGKTDILAGNYWYERLMEATFATCRYIKSSASIQHYIFKLCYGRK